MNDQSTQPVFLADLSTPTLTKAELTDSLNAEIGLNKREAKALVAALFALLQTALAQGTDVKLAGFGNFDLRAKASRPGRNPRTGEPVPIKARRVVTFHGSQTLREMIGSARHETSRTRSES
jgi:integration host factor subunit alpha